MIKRIAVWYINKFKKGIMFSKTYKNIKKNAMYMGDNSKFNYDIFKKCSPRIKGYLIMDKNTRFIMGHKAIISYGAKVTLHRNSKIIIGDNTYINFNFICESAESIEIGKNCSISWNVTIIDSDFHNLNDSKSSKTPVIIGDHTFIGCNSTILKGVHIGNNVIIGANSLVARDIPDNCLACGNPAKIIKNNIKWND